MSARKAATISPRLVSVLDATWGAIQRRHPDVPKVVITLASGTSGKRMNYGHFAPLRWQSGEDRLPEMLIGGEGLSRGARDVLGTLLHEAAHGVASTREIQDTSRQGRFHNAKFRMLAEELGLEVAKTGSIGWSGTSVPAPTAKLYRAELRRLKGALTAFRHPEARNPRRANSNNPLPMSCQCPRRIRVASLVIELGPIICGVCEQPFEVVL